MGVRVLPLGIARTLRTQERCVCKTHSFPSATATLPMYSDPMVIAAVTVIAERGRRREGVSTSCNMVIPDGGGGRRTEFHPFLRPDIDQCIYKNMKYITHKPQPPAPAPP